MSSTSIEIVWDDVSTSETGFEVQRSTDGTTFTNLASTAAGTTDYTDATASADTEYWYRVESTRLRGGKLGSIGIRQCHHARYAGFRCGSRYAHAQRHRGLDFRDRSLWAAPTDGSNLELEELGPTDSNLQVIAIPTPTTVDGQTVYPITGLTEDAQYSFRLRADLNGLSAYSTPVAATADAPDPLAPPTPTGLSVTAGSPSDPSTTGWITVSFDSPLSLNDDDGNAPFAEWQAISSDPYHLDDPSMDGEAQGLTGLTQSDGHWIYQQYAPASPYGVQVRVRVDAIESDGQLHHSAWTNWVMASPQGTIPAAPVLLAATPTSDGTSTVVTWDTSDSDEGAIVVEQLLPNGAGQLTPNGNHFVSYSSGSTTFPGTSGTYIAVAVGSETFSAYSNYVGSDNPLPATPQNLSATSASGGIYLLWDNDSDNETGFTIQRSSSADFSTDLQTFTVAADVTSYVDNNGTDGTSVQPGTTYYYQVEATTARGRPLSRTPPAPR